MSVRPCPCGATPKIAASLEAGYVVLQLKCQCGPKGARLLCASRDQLRRARQAALDGWNIGH